ncbi:ABC transporter substrate-binding protein [candidate division GN15 bacterium]|nr:ABC transporter substrate-binding protein [candidate division GN15 bacterium]
MTAMKSTWSVPMRSKSTVCLTILGLLAVLLACGEEASSPAAESGTRSVAVSIPPQQYLVDRIAGELADVMVLIPPGASPHTYELTPKQMAELAEIDLLFTAGIPYEEGLVPRLRKQHTSLEVRDTHQGIPLRPLEAGGDHHGHAHNRDPHTWLDPLNMIVHADHIRDALTARDSANVAVYRRNYAILKAELTALNRELADTLAPVKGREIFVFHPAWGYFTDAYGLTQVPIQIAGKEPGARQLAEILEQAESKRIRAIFVQEQYASQAPQTIADEIGAEIIFIDPLAYDYMDNLREVAGTIREAVR